MLSPEQRGRDEDWFTSSIAPREKGEVSEKGEKCATEGWSVWSISSVSLTSLVELEKPNTPKELDRPDRPVRHPNDEARYLATGWLANSMATRIFSRLVASNSCP